TARSCARRSCRFRCREKLCYSLCYLRTRAGGAALFQSECHPDFRHSKLLSSPPRLCRRDSTVESDGLPALRESTRRPCLPTVCRAARRSRVFAVVAVAAKRFAGYQAASRPPLVQGVSRFPPAFL